jgi:hypothetical protein
MRQALKFEHLSEIRPLGENGDEAPEICFEKILERDHREELLLREDARAVDGGVRFEGDLRGGERLPREGDGGFGQRTSLFLFHKSLPRLYTFIYRTNEGENFSFQQSRSDPFTYC